MIPLINNLNPKPTYYGYPVQIGETPEHRTFKPTLQKIDNRKIIIAGIGASVPDSIFTELEILNKNFVDIDFIKCSASGQTVTKWNNLNDKGWRTVKENIGTANYKYVQHIICNLDDGKNYPFAQQMDDLQAKIKTFIAIAKGQFPNLKIIDFFSRLNANNGKPPYGEPTAYHNAFAMKLLTESTFLTGHLINGVWITDAPSMWTNGEEARSDGFKISFSWFKSDGIHVAEKAGNVYLANYLHTYLKIYNHYK